MSATFSPALPTIAFQLAAAIENYQSAFEALASGERTGQALARAGSLLDRVRRLGAAFPSLSGDVVELLIHHVQLVRSLYRSPGIKPAPLQEVVERQGAAAARMHRKCVALFSRA